MRRLMTQVVFGVVILSFQVSVASAGRVLVCPDTDPSHRRDVLATSAPEIKVRSGSQNESRRWAEIIRPLTQKAIKAAKAARATQIQDGIEHGCNSMEQFVGQIIPVPEKGSGCDHRVLTRPADSEHIWVQVVATCKYDWACCSYDEGSSAAETKGSSVGYNLEGPLNSTPAASTASATMPFSKHKR